jgi:N-methylhydantoinase A
MQSYLKHLEEGVRGKDIKRVRVMSSNGGSMSPQAAGRLAIRTALSGPAGGVAGAFALAQRTGFERIITLDMGGTSTDVAVCPRHILERDETLVGGLPVRGPTIDVLSVGAGGGSIARVDAGGSLHVGPESAGADPGPACYGRGERPTVTDAHVVLGRIAPEQLLGGAMSINSELSLAAMRLIAQPFDGDPYRAAAAVLRVANANMERALRVVSVERGHNPRDFTLVAFGGAGPLHACDLAAALRIPRVLVPPHPGVLSALGMATAPVVKDLSAAVMLTLQPEQGIEANRPRTKTKSALRDDISRQNLASAPEDGSPLRRLARTHDALEERGRAELANEGFSLDGLTTQTFLEMRYAGQSYELSVLAESLAPAVFLPAFHAAHRERFDHGDETRPVEVVTIRVRLVLAPPVAAQSPAPLPRRTANAAVGQRDIWFDGRRSSAAFYERRTLGGSSHINGPAVITQMDSTIIIPPDWRAEIDEAANLVLEPR